MKQITDQKIKDLSSSDKLQAAVRMKITISFVSKQFQQQDQHQLTIVNANKNLK